MKKEFFFSICVLFLWIVCLFGSGVYAEVFSYDATLTGTYDSVNVHHLFYPSLPFPGPTIEFSGTADFLTTDGLSTININNGGTIGDFSGELTKSHLYDSSVVNLYEGGCFSGGSGHELNLNNSSTLNINGGEVVCFLQAYNSSTINLYDGSCRLGFGLLDNSIMNIYGGSTGVFLDNSGLSQTATLNIYGYGFEFNPEGYWMPPLSEGGDGWWVSKLTGYTLEGQAFSYKGIPDPSTHSNVHLIPEPCSLFLLSLGALALRKRRRA